jgi:carbamoyltransferase
MMALPLWMKEKLWIPYQIETALQERGLGQPKDLYFTEHHEAHAASAFFPSPFKSAAILTVDHDEQSIRFENGDPCTRAHLRCSL